MRLKIIFLNNDIVIIINITQKFITFHCESIARIIWKKSRWGHSLSFFWFFREIFIPCLRVRRSKFQRSGFARDLCNKLSSQFPPFSSDDRWDIRLEQWLVSIEETSTKIHLQAKHKSIFKGMQARICLIIIIYLRRICPVNNRMEILIY